MQTLIYPKGGSELSEMAVTRSLGILTDNIDCLSDDHYCAVISRACNVVNFILRVFETGCTTILVQTFEANVLSLIDCACVVWQPQSVLKLSKIY